MQNKIPDFRPIPRKPPIIKKKLPKPGPLNPLQKLFRNNLIGIHIHPIQRRHHSGMFSKSLHKPARSAGARRRLWRRPRRHLPLLILGPV